jgi:hypothetical protein
VPEAAEVERLEVEAWKLFLEEILESFAGVFRTGRSYGWSRRAFRVIHGRGVFLHRHAEGEELAIVLGVFFGETLRHRLSALKLAAGIEVNALLAGMNCGIALRALAVYIEVRR